MQQRQKRPNKDEPTRADVFILTHTPKNGKPMKNATADIIVRQENKFILKRFFFGGSCT